MSTSRVICDLCGTEQEVESYGDYKCSNCGQEHCYDNDCYRIMLTEEQEEVLRQHRNGGIMIVVDREYLDGFKSALEAEEQERQKTGGFRTVVEVPQEYLDVFKPGNLSDTILQASIPDVKQYYKQALARLTPRVRTKVDNFTDGQIQNMTIECPNCGKMQDVTDYLPDKACDEETYTCRFCQHEFQIGWYAIAEVR